MMVIADANHDLITDANDDVIAYANNDDVIAEANDDVMAHANNDDVIANKLTSGGPFDGVNLPAVGTERVHEGVVLQVPDLDGHVVGTGGQQLATRVPLDRIHLLLHQHIHES